MKSEFFKYLILFEIDYKKNLSSPNAKSVFRFVSQMSFLFINKKSSFVELLCGKIAKTRKSSHGFVKKISIEKYFS